MKLKLKYCFTALIAAVCLLAVLACLPYKLVASPNSTLRVVDEGGKPFVGIRVSRQWDTSEDKKGEDSVVTDNDGQAHFKRVEFRMSWLKRITKPLLILVPASCGPGWEVYGHAEFDVYWPSGYTLKFDDKVWKKVEATYINRDGIHVYDSTGNSNTNYVGLYTFNKQDDYSFTLMLYKQNREFISNTNSQFKL